MWRTWKSVMRLTTCGIHEIPPPTHRQGPQAAISAQPRFLKRQPWNGDAHSPLIEAQAETTNFGTGNKNRKYFARSRLATRDNFFY